MTFPNTRSSQPSTMKSVNPVELRHHRYGQQDIHRIVLPRKDLPTSPPIYSLSKFPTYSPSFIVSVSLSQVPSPSPSVTLTKGSIVGKEKSVSPSKQPLNARTLRPTLSPSSPPSSSPPSSSPPSSSPPSSSPPPSSPPPSSPPPSSPPSDSPTLSPTLDPSFNPTSQPTFIITSVPTSDPTLAPSSKPTLSSTTDPTLNPTFDTSSVPTSVPTLSPTSSSTLSPTSTLYPSALQTATLVIPAITLSPTSATLVYLKVSQVLYGFSSGNLTNPVLRSHVSKSVRVMLGLPETAVIGVTFEFIAKVNAQPLQVSRSGRGEVRATSIVKVVLMQVQDVTMTYTVNMTSGRSSESLIAKTQLAANSNLLKTSLASMNVTVAAVSSVSILNLSPTPSPTTSPSQENLKPDLIPSVQGEVLSSNRLIAFIVGGTLGGVLLIGTLAAFLSYYFGVRSLRRKQVNRDKLVSRKGSRSSMPSVRLQSASRYYSAHGYVHAHRHGNGNGNEIGTENGNGDGNGNRNGGEIVVGSIHRSGRGRRCDLNYALGTNLSQIPEIGMDFPEVEALQPHTPTPSGPICPPSTLKPSRARSDPNTAPLTTGSRYLIFKSTVHPHA